MGESLSQFIIEPVCYPMCKCCNNFVRYNLNGCSNKCSACGFSCDTQFPYNEVHETDFNTPTHKTDENINYLSVRVAKLEYDLEHIKSELNMNSPFSSHKIFVW